jgi:hypothetical protein
MWCCGASLDAVRVGWAPPWWPRDNVERTWPLEIWPELVVCAVLAFPALARFGYVLLLPLYVAAAWTAVPMLRRLYRTVRVQDRRTKIARAIKHATHRLLVQDGAPVQQVAGERDSFTLAMWREGADAMQLRERVREATRCAIERIQAGEVALAFAPECATTAEVPALALRLGVVGSGVALLATGAPAATAGIALAVLYRLWELVAVPLLAVAQRALVVSAAFRQVRIVDIRCHHEEHDSLRMTVMLDIEPLATSRQHLAPQP